MADETTWTDNTTQREMTLDEWCATLPEGHRARRELTTLRARAERAEGAIEDAAVLLDALGQMHATQLIRQGRTDGRDDFGPEVRAASDRWRAFRTLAAMGE